MIKESLSDQRDKWRALGANYWLALEFILRNGKSYQGQPLPRRYAWRMLQACFRNSYELVRGSKTLRYCEGICSDPGIGGFEFQHAWALDKSDRVIDPTLRQGERCEYFGVTIERQWLRKEWRYEGILADRCGCWRIEVLEAIDPGWAELRYQ